MHGEGWIKGCEASDKVIFEDPNGSFCGIAAVIVRGHKSEVKDVVVEEFL